MESTSTSTVLRRIRPLAGCFRYYPYTRGMVVSRKEEMKEEVVRLGVELSLYVAESMFLLCDDLHTMLGFCFKLWKSVIKYRNPVLERLIRVIHYVYSKDIIPKNGVYQDGGISVQWEFISTTWKDFSDGIIILHRLDMLLRRRGCSFEDRLLSSAIAKYKRQVLKKLEDKFSSAKDVSDANGFARAMLESDIYDLWKSLFHEEATPKVIRTRILTDLFTPLLGKPVRMQIVALPVSSPYVLGKDFSMQEQKEDVVQLGVEFSVYVAQSMFLLCDDIGTMLGFCFKLWTDVIPKPSPVLEKLLLVIHYVYSKDIKPKNGVYQDGGNSVQWEFIRNTWKDFADGIIILHRLDMVLRGKDSSFDDRQLSSAVEKYKQQVLKKLEDKLRSAEDVSEANGFARARIESNIYDLWKSIYDKAATSKVVWSMILSDLFTPLLGKPVHSKIQALPVCSPYILGKDFATQELKEEVVRLGVELSLYVAQSMFLLCDDIRTMLWFCLRLWRDAHRGFVHHSPVVERLFRVIHYVYTKDIRQKNGVYQNDGNNSVQWELVRKTLVNFAAGFRHLVPMVSFLLAEINCGREFICAIEEEVKKVEEKLWCVKAVSEANGFARDAMESIILDLWRDLFDEEAKEATLTLAAIKTRMFLDLFLPLTNEAQLN